jgi:hypothetical protein
VHLLDALAADFQGLRDVSADAGRAKTLAKQPDVRKALDRERTADDEDWRTVSEIIEVERTLADSDRRAESLLRLRTELAKLSRAANAEDDSPSRSRARRLLRMITAGASERVDDREYRAILDQYRLPGRGV